MTSAGTHRRRANGGHDHEEAEEAEEQTLTWLGRVGLGGRTGFYLILTALTVRIAVLGGATGRQADANGALGLLNQSILGQAAIAGVALGFLAFGLGRLVGAVRDRKASWTHRAMTVAQGVFYVALAYVPVSFLAGHHATGSQQQQQKTTADILHMPGGRVVLIVVGVVFILVCAQQVKGAIEHDFRDGLELGRAPGLVRRLADLAGVVGISARALVFLPVGLFLIVSAVQYNPDKSYGTDAELLLLSGHAWGIAVLAGVAAGLAIFVCYSAIETRYRSVISAR